MIKKYLYKKSAFFLAVIMTLGFTTNVFAQPGDSPDYSTLSSWAETDVKKAYELNILQPYMARDFKRAITREEFCDLCTSVISKWYNCDFTDVQNVESLKSITDKSNFSSFSDTGVWYVEFCAKLGIISGKGNGKFEPELAITREEAAKMLYNTLDIVTPVIKNKHTSGDFSCCGVHKFGDSADFESWSRNEINHMYRLGIMLGVSENNFEPKGNYTREQAYCTFLRLYYAYAEPEKNTLPEADLMFAYGDLSYYGSPVLDFNMAENVEEEYKPLIIDSNGKHYSKEEKGWLPEGVNFAEVIDAAFPGVNFSHIIDNEGHIMLKNVAEDGSFYGINVMKNIAIVVPHSDYSKSYIYNLVTGDLIIEGTFENYTQRQDLYKNTLVFIKDNKYGLLDCENGSIIIPPKYKQLYDFYNDLAIARKSDNTYSIVDIKGNEIKSFKLNFDVEYARGTNMICKPVNYNEGDKYFVYRAYSGKKTDYYSHISFADYEIIALRTSPHNYFILNSDCSVKKDCKGYSTINYVGCGLFSAYKDNGESGLVDIINKEGKVILTDVPSSCKADDSGIIVFAKGEEAPVVTLYDFKGNLILNQKLDNYTSTGYGLYNPPMCYFVNGAVFIPNLINNDTGENEKLLLMPNGAVFK